jgi:two-component system, NtrC family, sensor kinase
LLATTLFWKMREIDPIRHAWNRWRHLHHSLSAKLISRLLLALLVSFGLLGYLNIRLHRQHLETAALTSAERVSDVIKRSTSYYMLRNDRQALYQMMRTMADEPGMVRVRVFDQEGRISYSSDVGEISRTVDKNAEACYGCHAQSQPLSRLNRPDRFRIYRASSGERVLGIVTPLENQPSCSNAECHAHPASQQILGVLDTNLSLARADAQLAQDSRRMAAYTALALVLITLLCALFIWKVVAAPLKSLSAATEHLAEGRLGFQIATDSKDEFGDLARSFNIMSLQLRAANEEIVSWARTLEERVAQKTRELQTAHNQMLHAETMASIGKMAAVVAHEINNPLSGILTYAKLLRRWLDQGETGGKHREDTEQCLDLVARESRRCGDLVKNLLTFSRSGPMNPTPTDLHMVIDQLVRLVQPKLDMTGIQLQLDLSADLPRLNCDAAQMEQVLLALVSNAIDAMPRGGNLWLGTRLLADHEEIEIQVRDDGSGIPPDILARIFEPFMTTKESGQGVGLGLAISHSIVERHRGTISVQSELGRGTTFTIRLPLNGHEAELAGVAASDAGKV